ncbi:MAG: hypothetical protein AAFZ01_10925 [Pseudomonadota bacterium]
MNSCPTFTPLTPDDRTALEHHILEAHSGPDLPGLARGYRRGGDDAFARGEIDAACFLFTQAYVFALKAGLLEFAEELRAVLMHHGREA